MSAGAASCLKKTNTKTMVMKNRQIHRLEYILFMEFNYGGFYYPPKKSILDCSVHSINEFRMHISFGLTLLWSFGSLLSITSLATKTPFSIIDCAEAAEKTGNWKENWSCKCWAIWAWIVFIKNSCNWNHLKLKIWAHPSGLVFVSVVVYSFWKLGKFCFFWV